MLETELKKLTVAVEALTAAMGNFTDTPLGATTMGSGEEAPVESSDISDISREELSDRTLALVRNDPAYRQEVRDVLASLGAKKVPDLGGDELVAYHEWLTEKEQG